VGCDSLIALCLIVLCNCSLVVGGGWWWVTRCGGERLLCHQLAGRKRIKKNVKGPVKVRNSLAVSVPSSLSFHQWLSLCVESSQVTALNVCAGYGCHSQKSGLSCVIKLELVKVKSWVDSGSSKPGQSILSISSVVQVCDRDKGPD